MKKALSVLICTAAALIVLYPVGVLLTACFGYTFTLASVPVYAAVTALTAVCAAAVGFPGGAAPDNKVIRVILCVNVPLSILHAVMTTGACSRWVVVLCAAVTVGCCVLLAVRCREASVLKKVTLIAAGIVAVPACIIIVISLIVNGFGKTTVVRTVTSPDGSFCAEVIDHDEGALGGSTLVEVYAKPFNAGAFRIGKRPETVYKGAWGEFETMEIYWKGEHCLVIDSVEHKVE